jgi:methyl-accepting chemotaxis protein
MPNKSQERSWEWTIGVKMALIGVVGLAGLLVLGGIGYWVSDYLTRTSAAALQDETEARQLLAQASARAVQSERQARLLGELNQDLIALLQSAVDGPTHPKKGITAEEVLRQARELVKKSQMVRKAPGGDKPVPGTKLTLADQIVGNFEDVAVLLEYELPGIYALQPGTPAFVDRQGAMVVSLTEMYWFISRTLGELADNLGAQVQEAQADLQAASIQAGRLTQAAKTELGTASRRARTNLAICFATTVGLLGVLFAWFRRSLTIPLKKAVQMISELEQGHLDVRLGLAGRDEINRMGQAMDAFAADLQTRVLGVNSASLQLVTVSRNVTEASQSVDSSARAQVLGVEKTGAAVQSISHAAMNIGEKVSGLASSAAEGSASAMEMSANIEQLAGTAESLALTAEEVGASIAEMASSIAQVAANTGTLKESSDATASSANEMDTLTKEVEGSIAEAVRISDAVRKDAEAGESTVEASISGIHQIRQASQMTSEAIGGLSEKVRSIGRILAMIEEVTNQTSLLALNAAIIAAQAGEHGRGFAVVAEEIRELSDHTSSSTREIAEVIDAIREETDKVVQAIALTEKSVGEGEALSTAAGAALKKIVQGIHNVDQRMEQIVRATREQTQGSRSILVEMGKVAEMVDQTVGATREQSRAAANIGEAVERLKELTIRVKTSAREQSNGSKGIAAAMEDINQLLQDINQACENQNQESVEIRQVIQEISRFADANLGATELLQKAAGQLDNQVHTLQNQMGAFRLGS